MLITDGHRSCGQVVAATYCKHYSANLPHVNNHHTQIKDLVYSDCKGVAAKYPPNLVGLGVWRITTRSGPSGGRKC
jgi:hypothetical protein